MTSENKYRIQNQKKQQEEAIKKFKRLDIDMIVTRQKEFATLMKVTQDKQPNKSEIYSQHSTENKTVLDSYYNGVLDGSNNLNNTFIKAYHGEAIRAHQNLLQQTV